MPKLHEASIDNMPIYILTEIAETLQKGVFECSTKVAEKLRIAMYETKSSWQEVRLYDWEEVFYFFPLFANLNYTLTS